MEIKADRGDLPAPASDLTQYKVRHVVERYRDEISIRKLSYNSEVFILNAFLRLPMADYTLARFSPSDLSAYRDKRLKQVKPGTVNREFAILKHAFDIAIEEWGIPIRENPFAKIKKLKVNNARTRRLLVAEYEELKAAYEKNRKPYIMALVRFALETAMRRGEILRLRWGEISFETKTLLIPITKNGYARTIPLSREALAILEELKLNQNQDDLVFPVSDNAAKLSWQRLVERAGIKDLHFHDLRHEAVSRLFEKGLSIPEVALISGHRDFKMLFRYTHLKPEDIVRKLN